jgi:glucan phosphorylase
MDHKNFFSEFNKSESHEILTKNPIAYFCAEFALTSNIPTYAGGLGVLAGDLLREANDQNFPIVAVGLYYHDGYETLHNVDTKGFIEAPHTHRPPQYFGLSPLTDKKGEILTVTIQLGERNVTVKAWNWQVGNVPVFLLDTDCSENSEEDKKITDHLYVTDRETRLKQEMILGICGSRILEKLNITPSLYHMNEGHSGFLIYEIIGKIMKLQNITFEQAVQQAGQKIVFTNHTLVSGGQEIFETDLVSLLLSDYSTKLNIPVSHFLSLGKIQDATTFSMTHLCLNVAKISNAVSKIHAKSAKDLWPNHPLIPITNGIHIPTWNAVNEQNFWNAHSENKRILLERIRISKNLKWQETDLIIGWARRLVDYKRPKAILENIEEIKKICGDPNRPVRIIFSGTLHPSDAEGANVLDELLNIIDHDLSGSAVFFAEYNLDLAKLLIPGCDIWLNTPVVGFEACGTSGMKAALNGVLPLSTKDGWVAEVDLLEKGWSIDSDHINESVLATLKENIIPMFFERDENGVSHNWAANMKNSRELILNDFSATRMLAEYIEKLYLPLISTH